MGQSSWLVLLRVPDFFRLLKVKSVFSIRSASGFLGFAGEKLHTLDFGTGPGWAWCAVASCE